MEAKSLTCPCWKSATASAVACRKEGEGRRLKDGSLFSVGHPARADREPSITEEVGCATLTALGLAENKSFSRSLAETDFGSSTSSEPPGAVADGGALDGTEATGAANETEEADATGAGANPEVEGVGSRSSSTARSAPEAWSSRKSPRNESRTERLASDATPAASSSEGRPRRRRKRAKNGERTTGAGALSAPEQPSAAEKAKPPQGEGSPRPRASA